MSKGLGRSPSISQRIMTSVSSSWPFGSSPASPKVKAKGKLAVAPGTTITSTTYASASAMGKPVSIHVPAEIVDMIIAHVKLAHNCRTCYVRDLASLSLVNKSFHAAVEDSLYTSVQIHDGLSRRSWTGTGGGSGGGQKTGVEHQPMALFLRTLNGAPELAEMVRFLDLSADPDAQPDEVVETFNLIAKIISACKNLESFKGETTHFPQPMNGNKASAVGKALYSTTSIREQSWWATVYQAGYQYFGFNLEDFVGYHDNWPLLETLVMRGWITDRALNKPLKEHHFLRIWKRLSMRHPGVWHAACAKYNGIKYDAGRENYESKKQTPLKRLYLTKFTLEEFTDSALEACAFAFPELQAMRLERVAAISKQGLLKWAECLSSDAAQALSTDPSSRLESLTITECMWARLGASELRTLLLNLPHLRKFTFRPWKDTFTLAEIPEEQKALILEEESKGWPTMEYQPVLSHEKLEYLFWQVVPAMPANYWLYYSILSRGLPRLRTLTAPNDTGGTLQSLCEVVVNPAKAERERLAKMVPKRIPAEVVKKAWRRAAMEAIEPSTPPPLPLSLLEGENRNKSCDAEISAGRRNRLPGKITFDLRCQHPHCHSFFLQDRDLCWVKTGQRDDPAKMYDEDDELDQSYLDHPFNLKEADTLIPTTETAAIEPPITAALLQDFAHRFPGLLPPDMPDVFAMTQPQRAALAQSLPDEFRALLEDYAATLAAANNISIRAHTTAVEFAERNAGVFVPHGTILNRAPPARTLEPHEYEGEDYTCEYGDNAEYGDERDLRRQRAVQKECEVGGTWCCGKWNSPASNSGVGGGSSSGDTSPVMQRRSSLIARTASMSWRSGRRGSSGIGRERNWWHVPRPVEDLGRGQGGLKDFF